MNVNGLGVVSGMNPSNNESHDAISEKVRYWVDCWTEVVSELEQGKYGLSNPQTVLRDIRDEIRFNGVSKSDYMKYFEKQITSFLDKDPSIKKAFHEEFTLVRREFGNARREYFAMLCEGILREVFESGKYFRNACLELNQTLSESDSTADDEQGLRILSQHLVVEFILKGYSLKTIGEFPMNLLDKCCDGSMTTRYPHGVDVNEYTIDGQLDYDRYHQAVMSAMESLTLNQRVGKLEYYYTVEPQNLTYIFEVRGLKGDIDIQIGNVNFYSPKVKRHVKKGIGSETNPNDELFGKQNLNYYCANAATTVRAIDREVGRLKAMDAIEAAFDAVKFVFPYAKTRCEILKYNYLVVDECGVLVGQSGSIHGTEMGMWMSSLDIVQ